MPPTRTIPPAKAVRTERTHEENQERAYIAASRRSDRSLEARVESARRASDIHKRRTGRSLRVTEQDVVNEEMYEEEDDDLPMQYRRLTAHLQTGSVDFNRRLAAYLTNQVAMRNAMDQMINNSYAQQYPNAPQFAHNNNPMFSPNSSRGSMAPSPTTHQRSTPYPSPHQDGFRGHHNPPFSSTSPAEGSHTTSESRRSQSTPATPSSPVMPQPLKTDDIKPDPDHRIQVQSATADMSSSYPPLWRDMGPFTTSLPPESQQLLGPGLDPHDPMTARLMAGSQSYTASPYYPWGNIQGSGKIDDGGAAAISGMYSTLAPSALESTSDFATTTPKSGPNDAPSGLVSGLGFNSGVEGAKLKASQGFGGYLSRENSGIGLPSGQITPGEGFWESFVHDGSWIAETAAE